MLMTQRQALEVVARVRGDRVIVTTMSSTGIWPELSDTPLDFHYMPSSMGQGPALGLGLALGQSRHGVIVLNGDGCMLMNLGALVTLASHPAQIFLVILDNGLYEVTGGQPTAGTGHANFVKLAQGAGIERVNAFESLAEWEQGAEAAFAGKGPVVVVLKVEARLGQKTPKPPRTMPDQIARLRQALGT